MEFLQEVEFWIINTLAALFYLLFFVSGYLKVSWNMKLKRYLGFGFLALVILVLIQYGWQAGITSVLVLIAWGVIATPLIKLIMKTLNPEAYAAFNVIRGMSRRTTHTSPEDMLESMQEESVRTITTLQKAETDERLLDILEEYGKRPTEIENLYQVLLASGVNDYVASKVVTNPKHLREFLELKSKGVSDTDAAFKLASEV